MKAVVLALESDPQGSNLALTPVCGEPVLGHVLRWLDRQDAVDQILVVAPNGVDAVQEAALAQSLKAPVRVETFAPEVGNAGALGRLSETIGEESCIVVQGKNWFDFDLDELVKEHRDGIAVATLALEPLETHQACCVDATRVELDRTGRILRLVGGLIDPLETLVTIGCAVFEPACLALVPEDRTFHFVRDLLPAVMQAHGVLGGKAIAGRAAHVDRPGGLEVAEARLCGSVR